MFYAQKLGEHFVFENESDAIDFVSKGLKHECFKDSKDVTLVRKADWEDEADTLGRVERVEEVVNLHDPSIKLYVGADHSIHYSLDSAVVSFVGEGGVFVAYKRGNAILIAEPFKVDQDHSPVIGVITAIKHSSI